MNLVQGAIRFPVTTTVGVLLVALFGTIALFRLPIQLTPEVEEPQITVGTIWPGASPHEVEREIVDEQEEQLKSLEGLSKMESTSSDSSGNIVLTFPVGTDIDSALLKVSNALQQVPAYPADADKPVIRSQDVNASAIAWFILAPTRENGFEGDIASLYDFADDFIKPEFERVDGVAASNIYGGKERELQVVVDPSRLAARNITLTQLGAAIDRENRDYSGGDFDEGKRRYVVRTIGEYRTPEEIENIVVTVRDGIPVYLRDVARAELGFRKPGAKVFALGRQVLAINAVRETGANVLDVMDELKATVARLNDGLLGERGLALWQAYDETDYIHDSLNLVRSSLYVGAVLAAVVLLLFLRSVSSTLVIVTTMPISLIGSFLVMLWFGRTLNVVSLAGMAFAIGMVVDNSIVVLENIYRHRQLGKPRFAAAHDGAREVWGAVLASTLTTIAVFLPVLFIQEEAGQLFGDIALALSCGVGLSLIVSVTVIPSLSARILSTAEIDPHRSGYHNLWGGVRLAERFVEAIAGAVWWLTGSVFRRLALVVVATGLSLGLSWLVMPKREYLPLGNQNFLFGIMLPPPGYSLDEVAAAHDIFTEELKPLWQVEEGSPEAEALPGGGVRNFFYVALNNQAFMGVRSNDPLRVAELQGEFQRAIMKIPGSIGFIQQASIFQRGLGEGRNIDVEITGPDLGTLIGLGGEVFGQVAGKIPGAQARPIPSLDLGNPEVHVVTNRRRAADLGVSNRELGFTVNALVDGVKVSDYLHEGREIDLMVKGEETFAHRTHLLEQMPIATPGGQLVTIGSVADVAVEMGPVQIMHRERQRSITIQVGPPTTMPLETAMDIINDDILKPMRDQGRLGGLYQVELTGSADKLAQTGRALMFNFMLAIVITYLLMAALFESFLYPFVIMFSVPLAALGGFMGLWAVNFFMAADQKLDVLTMLGFIILVGTVVNNAILIVHQSLNHMREESMPEREAIRESVSNRIRPIFMSVSTSVVGMLPLVLFPGAGSELYRGLGSVIVGGLVLSTVFTLFVVPSVFSLALDARSALLASLRRPLKEAAGPTGSD
ncbi:MAG TPA: efflux RND transporter permease subunit [Candidatus Polarisedimenticolia bacterium]|nr:efflux RND transporter permease subunit [Candidatus Polarisedimenticolia bacterium]